MKPYSLITQNRTNYYHHHVQPQNQSVVCLISLFRYSYVFLSFYTLFPKQFGEFTLLCWLIVAKYCLGSDPSRSTPSMKQGNIFIFSFLWLHPAWRIAFWPPDLPEFHPCSSGCDYGIHYNNQFLGSFVWHWNFALKNYVFNLWTGACVIFGYALCSHGKMN